LDAHIVNYADDLVICCRGTAKEAAEAMRDMMRRLKLTVNEAKTRIAHLPEDEFDFLGYTIGVCYSPQNGRRYIGTRPSKKSVQSLCRAVSARTQRRTLLKDVRAMVAELNRMLRGWANYFHLGPVSKAYRAIDAHTTRRLRRWLCDKHQKSGTRGARCYPDEQLYEVLGLVRLPALTRSLPWAKA
jgi:hypothetical protein